MTTSPPAPSGETWVVDATVGTCGPFWDLLRVMDLSKPGDIIDLRCRQVEEVMRYAYLLVRAAGGELVRLEVEDGVAHLVIRKVR
ncbi:MAG: hypothetical protein QN173_04165 [Armatimonadota bacterium]|nr:hypothetical protein [Armatimonadota bacterium]MDR7402213.1 hypothetical protein [Armatimonadota bacterium]MDR7403341.1 hypothetical protein [Armatimonadota bacterium]MDR7436969.1 hypothetical protein [Armatimonadota bacterium]MDR7472257.1 hypothetical protein [Armatimonadota bacterium]